VSISKKDLNLLLILLGLILLAVSYFVVYSHFSERTKSLEAELNGLRPQLNELRDHESNLGYYKNSVETYQQQLLERQDGFDRHVRTEDWIMYVVGLMEGTGVTVDSISVSAARHLRALTGVAQAPDSEEYIYKEMEARQTSVDISTAFSYAQLKDMVNFIYNRSKTTALDTISITYNSMTGNLRGSATLNKIFLTSPDAPYEETIIDRQIPIGNRNPFRTVS
jgi:hypothetical protein